MSEGTEPTWTRITPWRQGHVLPQEAIVALGLAGTEQVEQTRAVVISHDCDLANEDLNVEPDVEVLIGQVVDKLDGNFAWGKSPRTLHLSMTRAAGSEVIELVQPHRGTVPKSDLARFTPSADHTLDQRGLSTLRSWLSSRYNRAAFADTFVNRFRSEKGEERLVSLLRSSGDLVSFVYFNIQGGHSVERAQGDPYIFTVVLVYDPGEDEESSMDRAEQLANRIDAELKSRLKNPTSLVLLDCVPLSESDVTVSQAKLLTQWRLEYMTTRADEQQPGPPAL